MLLDKSPYPNGPFEVVLAAGVPNGFGAGTGVVVARYTLPFAAKVRKVIKSYKSGTAHLDVVELKTISGTTARNGLDLIAAVANPSADVDGVDTALDADILGVELQAGDQIAAYADSSGSNEAGILLYQIFLDPVMTRPPTANP
jgi:hypothetical protein